MKQSWISLKYTSLQQKQLYYFQNIEHPLVPKWSLYWGPTDEHLSTRKKSSSQYVPYSEVAINLCHTTATAQLFIPSDAYLREFGLKCKWVLFSQAGVEMKLSPIEA